MHKSKPSQTARKVALNILTLSRKPGMDQVLPAGSADATAHLLVAAGAVGPKTVQWARSPRMVSVYQAFDWMLPGQFEAFAYRKAFCELQVREGIGAGATQVLVLGAGYDTMGWRLASEFSEVKFFEIDHPATASLKARGIEAMGGRDNLFLIQEDLGERQLVDVLKAREPWDQRAGTVIVAEGLLQYLPAEAVRDLFTQCALITGAGSRMAFTYIPSGDNGRPDAGPWSGLLLWLLKRGGEPWLWSIRPEELGHFLSGTGWTVAPELIKSPDKYGVEFHSVAIK